MKMDKSISKILEVLPYVHFIKDFQYKTFRDFFCFQIALARSIFELEKGSFLSQNFARNLLVMLSVSNASKKVFSAGKTWRVLRYGASEANWNCAPPPSPPPTFLNIPMVRLINYST